MPVLSRCLPPLLLLVLLPACASLGPEPRGGPVEGPVEGPVGDIDVVEPGGVQWTVATRPELDLWYHGLAYTGLGLEDELPIYQPGYVDRIVAAKRARGIYPTPLDREADEFARRFAADRRFGALQFLPLQFPSGAAFFQALDAWLQAQGDPARVRNPALQRAVAYLAQQFPRAQDRQLIGEWYRLLQEEQRAFYGAYRDELQSEVREIAAAVQARWDRLAPALRPYLDYQFQNRGELILSLPIGAEGRTARVGQREYRVAVGLPAADEPERAVWAAVHELMYALVAPVIADQVAPARLRELNEPLLQRRAAVRAGALLLERVAPQAAPDYRAAYLRWAEQPVPAAGPAREQAFQSAYPLPEPLPAALDDAVAATLAGI